MRPRSFGMGPSRQHRRYDSGPSSGSTTRHEFLMGLLPGFFPVYKRCAGRFLREIGHRGPPVFRAGMATVMPAHSESTRVFTLDLYTFIKDSRYVMQKGWPCRPGPRRHQLWSTGRRKIVGCLLAVPGTERRQLSRSHFMKGS